MDRNQLLRENQEFKRYTSSNWGYSFFGNSITESSKGWGAKLGIDDAKNRNISADVVDGYLSRLGELIKFKPVYFYYHWHQWSFQTALSKENLLTKL